VQGPVVGAEYQLLDPLTVSAKAFFTNLINRPEDVRNTTRQRVQLDMTLKW